MATNTNDNTDACVIRADANIANTDANIDESSSDPPTFDLSDEGQPKWIMKCYLGFPMVAAIILGVLRIPYLLNRI